MRLNWKSIVLKRGQESHVTSESGVYAIKKVRRVLGLPVTQEFVYIGKSKNLSRRYKEHCSIKSEHNSELMSERWKTDLEFWYAKAERKDLDLIERCLIGELEPITNVVRYKRTSK